MLHIAWTKKANAGNCPLPSIFQIQSGDFSQANPPKACERRHDCVTPIFFVLLRRTPSSMRDFF
jgi:hypothetical protein